MAKQDNSILWIIGIVLIVALIINSQVPKQEGMIGLNVHYYKDGVEVFPQKGFLGFSVVMPPGESFNQIAFNITGTTTGEIPFSNIQIIDASPTAFKDALPITTQTLSIDQDKTLWISSLIDTVQFESMPQPVRFWVNISAVDDYTEETFYADGFIDLTIEGETCVPASCTSGRTDEEISCIDGICTRTCSYYTYSCINPTVIYAPSGIENFNVICPTCYKTVSTSSYSIDKTNYCWKINSYSTFTNIVYIGKTVQVWGYVYVGGSSVSRTTATPSTSFSGPVSYTHCFRPSSSHTGLSGCNGITSGAGSQGITTSVKYGSTPGGTSATSSWSSSYTRYTTQSTLNYDNKVCSI